jgi:5-formyltetrahydrofolate cyclo-ligase
MMSAEKCAMRGVLRERRKQLPPQAVEAAGAAVCALLSTLPVYQTAKLVIAYLPTENEIPTDRVIAESAPAHRELYLPKSGEKAGFVRWRVGEPLVRGPGGVLEPREGLPLPAVTSAVALVPVVGWDEKGTRLGRGGGFYDRAFGDATHGIVRLGLAYEFQRCPALPCDPWDVALDYIITEQRVLRCGESEVRSGRLQKGGLRL